eukprot:gene11568-30229_t
MCTRIFACSFAVLAAAVTADDDVAIGSLPPTMSCILGNGISPLNRFSCGQRLDVVANAVTGTTGTITLDAASLTGDLRLLTSSTGGSQYARGAIPSGAPFHVCVSVRGECRAGKVETTSELFVKGKFNAGNGYAGCNAAANKESFTGGSSKRMCSGNPVTNSERPSDWPYTFFRSCCKWESSIQRKVISSQPESATNRGREESSTVDDDGSSNPGSVAGAVGGSLVAICVLAAVGFFAVKKKNSTPQATQATQARAGSAAVQPGAASATLAHNPVYSPPAAAVAAASGGLYETIDDDSVASSMAPAGQAEGYELQAVPGTASAQRSNPATMPSHENYSGYTVAAPKTPIVTTAQSVYEVAELVPAEHYVYGIDSDYAETAVAEYAVIPAVPDDPDLSGYC